VCERVLGGRGPGVMGVPTVAAVTPRLIHSSAVFANQPSEGGRLKGVPATSLTADRRVVVEWRPNEKSRLYVGHVETRNGC